ncbi:MAG: DUF835 domain-containing protein [Thermococcus sp.]|nr:DUF835 domain-containing protein [Thermococcus sp.]
MVELTFKLDLEIVKLAIVTLALIILYRYKALFELSLPRSLIKKSAYVMALFWAGFLADVINDVYPTEFTKVLDDIILSFALLLGAYYLVDYMRKIKVPIEPSKILNGKSHLEKGAYLVNSSDINVILKLSSGKKVIALTRNPGIFKENGIPYLWLSKVKGENSIDPLRLPAILHNLVSKADENTVVVIDGLEYLILENGFNSVLKFLTALKDHLLLKGATLVILINPNTLESNQLSLLKREFKELDVKSIKKKAE